jgi:hypothetical protein
MVRELRNALTVLTSRARARENIEEFALGSRTIEPVKALCKSPV